MADNNTNAKGTTMTITEVTKHYTNQQGEQASYTIQQATVPVTVGGETREILVQRLSPSHLWDAVRDEVVVRFRTGKKEHVVLPGIYQRGSKFVAEVHGFRNRTCCVTRWAKEGEAGSGWTS
jgi:hypothetical protein